MLPTPRLRLILPVIALAAIVAQATAWYAWAEGFGVLDGLYMTVITLTTIGYGEVRPLDGSGKVFTMFLSLTGIGVMLYAAGTIAERLVGGAVADAVGARRRGRRAGRMRGHVVVCGQGRIGREIVRLLRGRGDDVLAVDVRGEALEEARAAGAAILPGDATEQAVLERANVARARALVAALDSDAGNAFVVLTARSLQPALHIVARAGSDAAARRLETAGADLVVSPYRIAAESMARGARGGEEDR